MSTLITGATVADGSDREPYAADVLLDGDRIVAVEPPGTVSTDGHEPVDARGLVVAPGFVDVHSHADNAPLLDEDDTTKILQGVTSEVVGNCGFSLAPVAAGHEDDLAALAGRLFPPVAWDWTTFAGLMARLDARGYVTNYAPLVGHGTLRLAVAGFADRPLAGDERATMGDLVAAAADAGAFGVSTGLIYQPGSFGDTDEIAAAVARLPEGRVYATHMRGEGAQLLDSVAEALAVGRRAGRRVQVSHLKASGRTNWGGVPRALEVLDAARAAGEPVAHDAYPYTSSSTMLATCLPPWAHEGGQDALLARLADDTARTRLRTDLDGPGQGAWENSVAGCGWDGILVASTASHAYEGRTLAELAGDLGTDPFGALVEVLRAERLRATMVLASMAEPDVEAALRHPATMVGSDGLPPGVGGKPHPRLFGTFPRVLGRYVRERGLLPLGTAVHRMTGLPAETFGLHGRGYVRAGHVADLVAFDPATVTDVGDYRDPVHPPEGIAWVMQAGHRVVDAGRWLGVRRGTRLVPS